MAIRGEYRLLLFLTILKNFTTNFECFVHTGPYGSGYFKRLLFLQFYPISIKLYEGIGHHGEIQAVIFLGNRPSFKILWHFAILIYGTQWKNPKMFNILKTADRRAKRMKI